MDVSKTKELSSEQTSYLFSEWGISASVTSFEEIGLDGANFSDDSTCEILASFINDAYNVWLL